jgi:hypothetical protein
MNNEGIMIIEFISNDKEPKMKIDHAQVALSFDWFYSYCRAWKCLAMKIDHVEKCHGSWLA